MFIKSVHNSCFFFPYLSNHLGLNRELLIEKGEVILQLTVVGDQNTLTLKRIYVLAHCGEQTGNRKTAYYD